MDDYFLIDRDFSKGYSKSGFNNELFHYCSKYMNDYRYEEIKSQLRYSIWRQIRRNNEVIQKLTSQPDDFRNIFDKIIKFYTKVKEAVLGIEEMWVFLIESLF
jgi:hypothetical protein